MHRIGPWLMVLSLSAVGCGGRAAPEPLRVAAASDLQAVMPKLVARFEREQDIKVESTIGASGQLAAQIRQGAPFDVFLAANRTFVEDLAKERVIRPESYR